MKVYLETKLVEVEIWEYNPDYIVYENKTYSYSHEIHDYVFYVMCGNGISL